jgi:hypothetical protein
MYDMAKRSLAFTVATGGLLLTGTGYAPAEAAVGFGTVPGPAQAQNGGTTKHVSPSHISSHINVRPAHIVAARPQQKNGPVSGTGATAGSLVENSGGVLSGNTVQIPIDLGLNLCGNQVVAGAVHDTVGGSTCGIGGAGGAGGSQGGASATAVTDNSGGVLSGNVVQVPVNIPVNACGNQVGALAVHDEVGGSVCTNGSGAGSAGSSAAAATKNSGGVLSGNVVQVPISVPVNACGNQVGVAAVGDFVAGGDCSNSGTPGASASGSVSNSGGVLSGNQVSVPITVPVNLCGDQIVAGAVGDVVGGSACGTDAVPPTPVSQGHPSPTPTGSPSCPGALRAGARAAALPARHTCPPTPPGHGPSSSPSSTPAGHGPSSSPSSTPLGHGPSSSPSTCDDECSPAPGGSASNSAPPPNGPSNAPSMVPPPGAPGTPPHGHLAGTGTEEGLMLAAAGAALVAGVGVRRISRHRRNH